MTRIFRLAAEAAQAGLVDASLEAQGFALARLPFYDLGRETLSGPFPLGSSLAARFGYIYIQDASSMLPALALAGIAAQDAMAAGAPVASEERERNKYERQPELVLDMCASPGGKTSLLSRLFGRSALVLANEPGPKRLSTLRRNLELMNELGTATTAQPGQDLPLPTAGEGFAGFDYILLDPPCSGWGTAEKNPRVLDLWQGARLEPLAGLQRLLLREAARLLRPGGALVYSTCTTNVGENEEQIAWALEDLNAELGGALDLIPLAPFAGFVFDDPLPPLAGQAVLRVAQTGLSQGFYIAALRKGLAAKALAPRRISRRFARSGKSRGGVAAGGNDAAPRQISRAALESPLCAASLLPPGEVHEQNGALYFKHAAGLAALPPEFGWRGFPLGRRMRAESSLRALMPSPDEAEAAGAAVLNLDAPDRVLALVSGRSLNFATRQSEVGLYMNGLALCRLKARGGRVLI